MWGDSVMRDALDEDTPRAKQWNQFRDLQEEVDQMLVLPRRRSSSSTYDKRRPLQRPASPSGRIGGHHRGPRSDHLDSPTGSNSVSPMHRRFPTAPLVRDPVAELRAQVPFLSSTFHCSDDDALLLLSMVGNAGGSGRTTGMDLEDRITVTEAEKRSLELRLEKRNAEIDRLKDELADARQKLRAIQQQASQSSQLLAQKRDEARKQLLLEEGRTQRLQHENKLLHQDIDKLKSRVHQHVMK